MAAARSLPRYCFARDRVSNVSHVINFELPNEPESYVPYRPHGTGERRRLALSLCDPEEFSYLLDIESFTGQRITVIGTVPEGRPANDGGNRRGQRNRPGIGRGQKRRGAQSLPGRTAVAGRPRPADVRYQAETAHGKPGSGGGEHTLRKKSKRREAA